MVERVARGRLVVPAAAALTVMAAGMMTPEPGMAAGQDTTLEMRVRVVEPCRIRLGPAGQLDHGCGSGGSLNRTPVSVRLSDLAERLEARAGQLQAPLNLSGRFDGRTMGERPNGLFRTPMTVDAPRADTRLTTANRRASDIAERIAQRVRHITVAY